MCNNKMREIREEKGMQLTELAQKTGISIGYLCHLEKGTRKNPSLEIMDKIAIGLGKSLSEVFFNK